MSREDHRRHDEQLAKIRQILEKPRSSFQEHLRQLEAISFVLSVGAILMENYFWYFVGFFLFGLLLEIVHSFTAKTVGKFRYVTGFFFIGVGIFFYFKFMRGDIRFETTAQWTEGNYQAGSDIHGLIWKDGWSELTISFRNPSGVDVNDFDTAFLVDEGVADVKQISGPPCSVFQTDIGIIDVTGKTKTGEQVLFTPFGFTDTPYRLLCAKFPAHTAVTLIEALVNMSNIQVTGSGPSTNIRGGPKKAPRLIRYHQIYKAHSRPYDLLTSEKPTVH